VHYCSFAILHTQYTKRRLGDFNVHAILGVYNAAMFVDNTGAVCGKYHKLQLAEGHGARGPRGALHSRPRDSPVHQAIRSFKCFKSLPPFAPLWIGAWRRVPQTSSCGGSHSVWSVVGRLWLVARSPAGYGIPADKSMFGFKRATEISGRRTRRQWRGTGTTSWASTAAPSTRPSAGLDEGLLSLSLHNLLYMENPYSYKACQ
jgi:hypothetical protein